MEAESVRCVFDAFAEAIAAALVGAGMLSVLLYPLTATRVRRARPVSGDGWRDSSDAL